MRLTEIKTNKQKQSERGRVINYFVIFLAEPNNFSKQQEQDIEAQYESKQQEPDPEGGGETPLF